MRDGFWETKENFPLNIFSETRCSVKVFLGGVPWDLTEASLLKFFKDYGNNLRNQNIFVERLEMYTSIIIKGIKSVQWPSEDQKLPRKGRIGFVYIVLKESKMVNELVNSSKLDRKTGRHMIIMKSNNGKKKDVEVVPWLVEDCFWQNPNFKEPKIASRKTVFVGGVHGMMTAAILAKMMQVNYKN